MPRNASGTYSLPAGNPVVTGETITTTWGNTTLADVAAEITNSLDRAGRGAMTGPLLLASGSVSAPGIGFSVNADVGFYYASDRLICTINGVDSFRISAAGVVEVFSGGAWRVLFHVNNDGAGSGLDADTVDGSHASAFAAASHSHAAGDITSGTFADARVAQSNVTQHQAALSLGTSQITSGTFADARVAQSNVTQHQAALAINTDQLTTDYADDAGTSYTLGAGDAESIRRFTSSSAITITLPNSVPSGWAVGDSMVIIRGGTGTLTFSSAGTIRSPGGSTITVQNGKACVTLAASGVWELSGNV